MHNNRDSRGSGYMPTSSRSFSESTDRFERWNEETEWSARDETWRGNLNKNGQMIRERNDSWKETCSSPRNHDFRLGRDRAPMPVDDHFLDRYGAKRQSNGKIVDRDGFTLRTRDPDCRAPSPPSYNPGREIRQSSSSGINRMTQQSLDEFQKARRQMEMVRKLAEEAEKEPRTRRAASLEEEKRRKEEEEKNMDLEGEDEYEEVVEEPPAKQIRREGILPAAPLPFKKNNIKKALLTSPPEFKKMIYQKKQATIQPRKSYYEQYLKNVEEFKEKTYGCSTSSSSSGHFFREDPPQYSNNGYQSYVAESSSYPYAQPYPYPQSQAYPQTYPSYPQNFNMAPPPPPPPPPPSGYSGSSESNSPHFMPFAPSVENAFGVFTKGPPESSFQRDSDSDSEDESIRKLREICRNYGPR